jgi:uncharacterized protein YbjT (DUF2867 family)
VTKVLVAGATGYLGRYIVKALKERGYWVRTLARDPKALSLPGRHSTPAVMPYIDEVFQGEVTQAATLEGICDGMDFVVSTIGITRQKDGVTFQDVDYQGNVNLLAEAERAMETGTAQVKKFLYVSVFKGGDIPGALTSSKERFVERLKKSAVASVVVRPTGYFSDMEEFLRMAMRGRVYLIGKGEKRMNPIHGADLAEVCAEALVGDAAELDVGGPQVYTHREIARLALEAAGRPENMTSLSEWILKTAIATLRIVSPASSGPLEFMYQVMSRDMVAPCYGSRDLLTHFTQALDHEAGTMRKK